MLDLAFWRLLRHRKLNEADLAAHLRELAEWPMLERLPFLGFLPPLLGHPQASIRAAALTCLAGCTGIAAYEHFISALQDSEETVRLAAVEVLRTSLAGNDWARWAHVMFHPKADVRLAAINTDRLFPPPDWWAVYLLPDPVCAEAARTKLRDLTLAVETVPVLIDYARRGILSRAEARRWVCRQTWQAVVEFFSRWGQRSEAQCISITVQVDAIDGPERLAEIAGFDPLDDVLELFTDAAEEESLRWLTTLLRDLPNAAAPIRQRILASVLVISSRSKESSAVALGRLAVILEPRVATCPWLPLAFRREALNGFYDLGSQTPSQDDRMVMLLLEADICRRADGLLDLWAIGAVLHLFASNPYQKLLSRFPIADVAAGFNADSERSVPFFTLGDRSPQGRKFLIRELCLQARPQRSRLLAKLCEVLPIDGLEFIEQIDAAVAGEITVELIERAPRMSAKKISRLSRMLAEKLAAGQIGPFLNAWMARPEPHEDSFGQAMLGALSRLPETRLLEQAVRAFPAPTLRKFLTAATSCAGFTYDRELALARMFVAHGDESIREWATVRLTPATTKRRELDETTKAGLLRSGLCHRLRSLPDPAAPDIDMCVSLLASHDLPEEVASQFLRFSSPDAAFATRLDEEMIAHWRGERRLPLLGHVWLYRWDEHAQALGELIERDFGDLPTALVSADRIASPLLKMRFWEATARLIAIWKWRDRPRHDRLWSVEYSTALINHLTTDVGVVAARLLMKWWEDSQRGSHFLNSQVPPIREAFLGASAEVRNIMALWIDTRGLQAAAVAEPSPSDDDVRPATDIETLFLRFFSSHQSMALAAAYEIVDLGERGINAIADLLCGPLPIKHVRFLADTLAHWPIGSAASLRATAALVDPRVPAETRYRIGFRLASQDEIRDLSPLFNALNEQGPVGWVDAEDWHKLLRLEESSGGNQTSLSVRAAISPQPHIYDPAIMFLTQSEELFNVEIQNALIAFLECGTGRMRELRVRAAEWLYKAGVGQLATPILLQAESAEEPPHPLVLAHQPFDVVLGVVRGFLLMQRGEQDEQMILALLLAPGVDIYAREEGLSLLLQRAFNGPVRKQARQNLRPSFTRDMKLRRVADTFAWGVRVGRELTSKLFSIEMISSEKLGYTRFTENKIYITPLPILRSEMNGRQVVRALILHEYGHHMYHRGEVALQVWKQSETEGMQKLLNLVSDEHLERNLRALDRRFGDQLKMLGAYAFQHTTREIPVEQLLTCLQGHAFEVLSSAPLNVARRHGCVAVLNGRVLMLMEKVGLSFARFVRALRMGLGNRHNDPKVDAGLALFKGKFRKSDMPALYEIAKKLREIFGAETDILNSFDQDASCCDEAGDWDEISEGITNDEVQSEVQRALQGKERGRERDGVKGGRGLNLGPDEKFDLIEKVQPMLHDPAQHASYAMQVKRPADVLRQFLKKLGIGFEQQRFRLSGKSFDRARARAVVLRGDPRMLIARELKIQTDLFIGVVVDCSGSMSHNGNIEKAKLFGTLIAEAGRNYPGVDVRLFGFTDQVIYDAGHANRCAVHALEAGGGNNDAAGLWHAALVAKASRRRAKLLVMISDGAPTECTVTALRSLVTRLTKRMKMCCAQVAVCPLEHQCFPNHILLDQENVEASVRQFGRVMAKLVQKALRGG